MILNVHNNNGEQTNVFNLETKACVLLTPDVKVHCNPRRYPEAARVNWRERIVSETEDYVLLDKPGGILFCPSALDLLSSMH